jgi:hypothetical protein
MMLIILSIIHFPFVIAGIGLVLIGTYAPSNMSPDEHISHVAKCVVIGATAGILMPSFLVIGFCRFIIEEIFN